MRKLKLFGAISLMIVMISSAILAVVYFTKGDKQARVVVTTFAIYDICRELMGCDDDNIVMLENAGIDMHSYQPTAGDIALLSKCDLFVCIGGSSDDKWLSDTIRSADNVNMKVLELMDIEKLTKLEENNENILEHDHEHHEHDHEHEEDIIYDEHIWLSIKNMIVMTESIRDELILVFPQKQELIKDNADKYIEKLIDLDKKYSETIANKSGTIIIADRFPFRYLVHDYNINYYAIFSGCSTESDAKAETIIKLNEKIAQTSSQYIFVLESSNRDVANRCVVKNPSLQILEINSCQTANQNTMQSMKYYDIMAKNLENLKKALCV